jgi:murein DD-endopeptidase MepM/ murein hydrolase activator NlpD
MVVPPSGSRGLDGLPALCAARSIPDGEVCVPLPQPNAPLLGAAVASEPVRGGHPVRGGSWEEYDQIPRRPDRPADHAKYLWPVGTPESPAQVLSGYDLHLPADQQRQGSGFKHTGHGGIDLSGARGDPIKLVGLEHQEGDAEVVFVGELFGISVVTSHTVREVGRLRQYLVLFGHLDRPGVVAGAKVREGEVVGWVGDSGSPGIVHLHLEVRQVREGATITKESKKLVDGSVSVVTDPRNVLPRRD